MTTTNNPTQAAMDTSLPILYQDDDVLVIDKPEGIATIPERTEREQCLSAVLERSLGFRPFVVHRLDKEVSGVIIFARNAAAHRALCLQFEHRTARKTYTAMVLGLPPEDKGVIDLPLRQFGSGRMGVDTRRGKPCQTEFEVIERMAGHALLSVHPHSGRRHQIRVHLYSLGHPIAGDTRYGDKLAQSRYARLMLHSSRLEVALPSGAPLVVESALTKTFTAVLERTRADGA